jgi:mxaA protein
VKRTILVLSLLCWMVVAQAAEISVEALNPRPFGYAVGDTLKQELIFTTQSHQVLDEKKIPKPGRLNAWVELKNIEVAETAVGSKRIYRVKLDYQLPNSPTEVRVIELPAQRFFFLEAGKSIEARSTEWPITMGPITSTEVLARDGLEALRPDVAPRGIDTRPILQRLVVYAIALGALLLYGCYRYFGMPFLERQRRPFTRTSRQLDRLVKKAAPDAFPKAIEYLHQALNETAGKSLFSENVEPFLAHRSIPAGLADMTRQFFQLSREEFFGAGVSESQRSLTWAREFCRAWRDVERGLT